MTGQGDQYYLLGLGSNMRHVRHGSPAEVLRAAALWLSRHHAQVEAMSDIVRSAAIGPSSREYANAVCIVRSYFTPRDLLALVNRAETTFGRQRRGQRWRQRTLDIDILLWSGGSYADRQLLIPHPEWRKRDFVLGPAAQIAGDWRDPMTGLSPRHLHARLTRPRPLPS